VTDTPAALPPLAIRHGTCGTWWTGANRSHCSNCHRTFSGLSAFDAHQRGWASGTPCPDPAERGLIAVPKKFGELWSWPPREPTDEECAE